MIIRQVFGQYMEQKAEKALRIIHRLLSDYQILHQLCLTNLSVFQMICLFEIADQMNAKDDPMLKILSAALPNLSNYNQSKFCQFHPSSSQRNMAPRK